MTSVSTHTATGPHVIEPRLSDPAVHANLVLDDAGAFEEFYDEHVRFVWRTLGRLGIQNSEREDVCQEVFVTVHRRWSSFEARNTPRSWLYGIVRKVAWRHRRGNDRRQRRHEAFGAGALHDTGETAVAGHVLALQLQQFLEQLDQAKRDVFVLAELEELSAREIAERVGVGPNTVYSRLRAARAAFETRFGPLPRQRAAVRVAHLEDAPTEEQQRRVGALLFALPWGASSSPAASGGGASLSATTLVATVVTATVLVAVLLGLWTRGPSDVPPPVATEGQPVGAGLADHVPDVRLAEASPAAAMTSTRGVGVNAPAGTGLAINSVGNGGPRDAEPTAPRAPGVVPAVAQSDDNDATTAPETAVVAAPAPEAAANNKLPSRTGAPRLAPIAVIGAPSEASAASSAPAPANASAEAGPVEDETAAAPSAPAPGEPVDDSAAATAPESTPEPKPTKPAGTRSDTTTPPLPTPEPGKSGTVLAKPAPKEESAPNGQLDPAELALLQQARAALDGHAPRRALASLRDHARRFRNSPLSPERDATFAEAHCALGHDKAARPYLRRLQRSGHDRLARQITERCR